ncbi:hypothetical protein [Paraliomyxa miuraensis]|uniref:hypothetical protein n=1 Tax=Paraliomyxa miuraensis TaxID=376150 RepID=UPI00225506A8|nr:hypothetical protein [Paraliomyxa miuraensis]MCX4243917.1 hypothetical protein [Paraliomyxa miuraensis]
MKRGTWGVLLGLAGIGMLIGVFTCGSADPSSTVVRRPKVYESSQERVAATSPRVRRGLPLMPRRWLSGATPAPESDAPHEELAEPAGDPDEDREEDDGDEDDEASLVREQELVARRIEDIVDLADAEPVDPSWAPAMERRIAEGLAAHAPPGATLVSASCRTTLCVAEIEFPPSGEGGTRVNWLTALGLPRGFFVHHEPRPGFGPRTVAYLARDGHSLPD